MSFDWLMAVEPEHLRSRAALPGRGTAMAALKEKHPREAAAAKELLAPFRFDNAFIHINQERSDDLEMKIAEALVEAYCRGVEAP